MKLIVAALTTAMILGSASFALAEDLEFMLTNLTSANVEEFYVSHVGTDDWEENLIEGAYLPSGNEVSVNIMDGRLTCAYDIQIVFDDGDVIEDYDLNLCDLGGYTVQ